MSAHEYDFEPIPGVPGIPPAGERILWHGSPEWKSVLVHVLAGRWFLAYVVVLSVWRFGSALSDGMPLVAATTSTLWLLPMWAAVGAALAAFAFGLSKTTIYTITTKRLIMRYGIALPMAVNIPFTTVMGAGLKTFRDGTGQIALGLDGDVRLAYLVIWPNARPGYFLNPQPLLRSLPDPQAVVKILTAALAANQQSVVETKAVAIKPSRPLKPLAVSQEPRYAPVAAE